jgi:glycosyltransferase involved in cell wall biosynthesis
MSDQRDLAMSLMPDQGIYDALNKVVRMATGDVIGFLHADDFLASSNVLSRIACAFENTGTEAVYGGAQYVKCLASGEFGLVRHRTSGIYHIRKLRWGWMPRTRPFISNAKYMSAPKWITASISTPTSVVQLIMTS